jgi:hypothetical protein
LRIYHSTEQVVQIIKRSLPFVRIDLDSELDAERFTLRLPLEMRGKFPEFGSFRSLRGDGTGAPKVAILLAKRTANLRSLAERVSVNPH